MVDFFDKIYTSIVDKSPFLKKIRFYSAQRFLTRVSSNVLIGVYFLLTKNNPKYRLTPNQKNRGRIVISLTSFPLRIKGLWMVIESLMRQTAMPDKIVLWLAKSQFPDPANLPKSLLKLQDRGLEIRFCDEDLRSHKKYYYALQQFPDDLIVTADDDIIYPAYLIEQLIKLHKRYPGAVCCHRAMTIKTSGNDIAPYKKWQLLKTGVAPDFRVFQTSGGGTLFPPGSLHREVLNKEVFIKYCFHADDVWLNAMSQYNNVKTAKTDSYIECLPVINLGNKSLHSVNITQGGNDKQIADVRKYYRETTGKDIFANIFEE